MRKTVTITIAGALFHIEEAAYQRLDQYLDSIRAHFASYPDADEIVSDIESRIAEEFSEKLKGKKKVISEKDVEELIHSMGTVEDFAAFEGSEPKASSTASDNDGPFGKRRLYRDSEDQILGGVCAGIANYFNIDPTIIRLIFAVTMLAGGTGFVIYILLWIILPEAKTPAEKVEMSQGKVTLSAIQKRIDATVPPEKRRSMMRKIVAFPALLIRQVVRVIGKIVRVAFPLLFRLIGVALTIGFAVAIAGVTSFFLMLLTNPQSPYIDFPLYATVGAVNYFLLLISGYFLALIPLLFLLLIGITLLTLRNTFTTLGTAAMIGVWFVALTVGTVTGFSVAPAVETAADRYEQQHFDLVEKPLDLKNFTDIRVGGNTRMTVTQGKTFSVVVGSTQEDWPYVTAEVNEGTLVVDRERPRRHCMFFCHTGSMTVTVTMPTLEGLDMSGQSYADVKGFDVNSAAFVLSGNSLVEAMMNAKQLSLDASGASHLQIDGSGSTITMELSGASSFGGYDFSAATAQVDMSGASRAMINATQSITGEASGSSHIYYPVEPATVNVDLSGASTVEQLDRDEAEWW